jgi:hypothetical protein
LVPSGIAAWKMIDPASMPNPKAPRMTREISSRGPSGPSTMCRRSSPRAQEAIKVWSALHTECDGIAFVAEQLDFDETRRIGRPDGFCPEKHPRSRHGVPRAARDGDRPPVTVESAIDRGARPLDDLRATVQRSHTARLLRGVTRARQSCEGRQAASGLYGFGPKASGLDQK